MNLLAWKTGSWADGAWRSGAWEESGALAWSEARKAAGRRWRLVPEHVRDAMAPGRVLAFEARRASLLSAARRRYLVRC
ncbi:MAG: hypothetical protein MUE63_00225 [Xanthomonadales bacterium]|jgi:hypothetical protein|nr:hypothetical protein [Xanthomonadales bacterium]